MTQVDPRTPVLIGVGQGTWHPPELGPEPLDMWEHVSRAAAEDAGASGDVLDTVDSARIVYCQRWQYDDPPGRLAERLGLRDGHRYYSGIGGTTPQVLVDEAAEQILAGEHDLVLVAGGEALDTRRRLKKQGEKPDWSHKVQEKRPFPFPYMPHQAELAHEVLQAYLTFALFDNARRGHLGVALDDYRQRLGELLEPMSRVAAENPHAWFPIHRSVDELITPTAENRLVAYPYTKYMMSVMDVDIAGAVLLASEATADELRVPRDRRVYLRGWAYAEDPPVVAARRDLWRSPGMEVTSRETLKQAGVGIDDVAHLDLYSCFTSSVLFARDALGIADDDDRPVTVTGGLPFFGGAGSCYMLPAIAEMAGRLRADAGAVGMVSGVGMHMTKHAYAAYSTEPGPVSPPDHAALQREVEEANAARPMIETFEGRATVLAYSVLHDRENAPERGVAVIEAGDGSRTYANIDDAQALVDIEREELVGREVEVASGGENVNRLAL